MHACAYAHEADNVQIETWFNAITCKLLLALYVYMLCLPIKSDHLITVINCNLAVPKDILQRLHSMFMLYISRRLHTPLNLYKKLISLATF